MQFLFAALLIVLGASNAPDAAMMQPVQQWIDAYNDGSGPLPEDIFTDDVVVTDEFPPFVWSGKNGEHQWAQSIDAFIKPGQQHVSAGPARSFRLSHDGKRASFILPATLTYTSTRDGMKVTEQALWLFVLVQGADGWKIAADTWTQSPAPDPPVTIPLRNENGVLLFEATVDDVGPLLFTLDPGGKDVYTTYTRDKLNGAAPKTVCLSGACFPAAMEYFEGDGNALFPRHDPATGALAGSIGPALLQHYVAQIDYKSSALTLISPQHFHPPAGSKAFPLRYDAFGLPLLPAVVDGIRGDFELDVRARTSMLFTRFLDQTGLRSKYAHTPVAKQSASLIAHAVRNTQVSGISIPGAPFWFATDTSGKFAGGAVAGLLGNNVLSHFIVTIDEPQKKVYLAAQRA
jgi:ketosteroid isomerase-like protein